MKKLLAGLVIWAVAALASATNVTNPPVNVNGNPGSVQISQCASVAGNCNNPDMTVNINGHIEAIWVDGKYTVIKGKDGIDGKDGLNGTNGTNGLDGIDGRDGAQGIQGDKGDTGVDGKNGLHGKDGITTTVIKNVVDAKTQQQVRQQQSQIERLEQQQSDDRKRSSGGIAGVAAMANIPQVSQNRNFSVGVGAGTFDSEQALAIGASARSVRNAMWLQSSLS